MVSRESKWRHRMTKRATFTEAELARLLTTPAIASRPPADLDLTPVAPNPRPEGLCEIHPLCKGRNEG